MAKYAPRSQTADLYRNRPKRKKESEQGLPVLFRGELGPGKAGNTEQRLDARARRRVREATIEQGELRGWVQLQVEWLRHWIRDDRLEPKDALTQMRGIQKSLQDAHDRETSRDGVHLEVNLGVTAEAVEALEAKGVKVDPEGSGDQLAIH